MEQRFCGSNSEVGETEELDETLSLRVGKAPNMETIVEELHDVLASVCSSSFKKNLRTTKKASTQISSLVDGRTYDLEEKGKCTATSVSKDERQ